MGRADNGKPARRIAFGILAAGALRRARAAGFIGRRAPPEESLSARASTASDPHHGRIVPTLAARSARRQSMRNAVDLAKCGAQ